MAYTTINKSTDYFNTKLYTGTGSTASITGVGFQPDFSWIKVRNNTDNHVVFDAVRTAGKRLEPNINAAEATISNELTAFNSDGFSIGGADRVNRNNDTYASWNWKANGAGSANTAGSINSTVSANTTSGFSIVSWTGTGANATVGHGLGVAPKAVIIKSLSATYEWRSYFSPIGAGKYMVLNETYAQATGSNFMNDTAPTSSVFSLGNGTTPNASGVTYIAYCFADVKGYSKIGSYVGNGNADGIFVYTGFKPAFILFKVTSTGDSWQLIDTKRDTFNSGSELVLQPDLNQAEADNTRADILSNGFKIKTTNVSVNGSGQSYIYMAFAEAPLVGSNNVPCTAR